MERFSRLGLRARPGAAVLVTGVLVSMVLGGPALAHPVPFSYLALHIGSQRLDGSLVMHSIDLAHDLLLPTPDVLLDQRYADSLQSRIAALVAGRLELRADDRIARIVWQDVEALDERRAIRLGFHVPLGQPSGLVQVRCALFPYDPTHQTFLNVYEAGQLTQQSIFDKGHPAFEYFAGSRQGTLAVLRRFIPAGIHHIAIGPDHILFLIGLLLVGGAPLQLLRIVTAFTIGHSLTLSLAATDVVAAPARLVEPAIALSIMYVGADNLVVGRDGRDVRAWIALLFGLVHGFGFASVLKEFGLPRRALGWSLFSFNLGVELGQLVIVVIVASLVIAVRRQSRALGEQLVTAGSVVVIGAGTYWFIERVFFAGGAS